MAGRSTLQNEIIGDLGKEFGSTPEGAEELSLDELATSLQLTFDGVLGPISRSLVARLVATKLPGDVSITTVRNYLRVRWRLATGRQDGVLLSAVAMQSLSRLGTDQDWKAFINQATKRYADSSQLVLTEPSQATSRADSEPSNPIDHVALGLMRNARKLFSQQQLQLYAKDLDIDLNTDAKRVMQLENVVDDCQKRIETWDLEHGQSYISGIQSIFRPLQIRKYDSFWNWAKQDFLELAYDLTHRRFSQDLLGSKMHSFRNRSSLSLLSLMRYHTNKLKKYQNEDIMLFLENLIMECEKGLVIPPTAPTPWFTEPLTSIDMCGRISYSEISRQGILNVDDYVDNLARVSDEVQDIALPDRVTELGGCITMQPPQLPFMHIRRKGRYSWEYSNTLTEKYLDSFRLPIDSGFSIDGHVLLTGAGKDSIGAEVLKGLLSGGAKVIVTTSSYSSATVQRYRETYERYGARGSELLVAPFNQGSRQDVEALVAHIYDPEHGLGWDLDYILPLAAMSESGREIDNIDATSELAHRIMLTNTLRLLGAVKQQKMARGFRTRPAHVILPLSPNHGGFGNDGLYAESKLALEALFDKWHSESWADYLSICGAVIGWTRGTGLMSDNDIVSSGIEAFGMRTFSREEMAFSILGLMAPAMRDICEIEPLRADLDGGLHGIPHLKKILDDIRIRIKDTSIERESIFQDALLDRKLITGDEQSFHDDPVLLKPRCNVKFVSPRLPDYQREIKTLNAELDGMVDLDKVIVVVGFSELGPWGNSRTRWNMEADGELSNEGCVEMAWIMGLIKFHKGHLEGKNYCGWIDVATKKPLMDGDIKRMHEKYILEHSGIRLVEKGNNTQMNHVLHEIIVQEDLAPFEAPRETAEDFKREHGDKVEILLIPDSVEYNVYIRKGAKLRVPKALKIDRRVAGELPTGWNPSAYGIAEDIISQVDPVTLYVLVCTAEAFLSAGITDPYEFYKYIHISEIGNCIGTGVGGTQSQKLMFNARHLDGQPQNDVLQEVFLNTSSAWINLLFLSSSGPIKTPVGACATSLESLESGYETILSGKAKVCLVGGYDDLHDDISTEFGNMNATVNVEAEFARGRTAAEMSRPTTSSRNGFVEAQGAGIQVITSARLALEMGLPIYGIVALVQLAADKIGRSIPAPGRGIMSNVRETSTPLPPPMMDIKYRRMNLNLRNQQIEEKRQCDLEYLQDEIAAIIKLHHVEDASDYFQERQHNIHLEAEQQKKVTLNTFGSQFWKGDARISPMRGALAVWGLTIDDLTVASFHGTSTQKNDINETQILHEQLSHLGRQPGNAVLGVCQKYLTGHSKGAAGAWMLNGCLQMLDTGFVPGNRNADNIDAALEQFHHIVFPSRGIQTDGIKAFSVTSFGFGQKGAQAIGVHPKYVFATISEEAYASYSTKVQARQKKAYRCFHEGLVTNRVFVAKDKAPFEEEDEMTVLTNAGVRFETNKAEGYRSFLAAR